MKRAHSPAITVQMHTHQVDPRSVFVADEEVLRVVATTETPQQVAAIFPRPELAWPETAGLVLICDGVSDPGNMGTLIRTAGGTGVDGVVLLGPCADPWSPKALRSAMGATLRVPLLRQADYDGLTASPAATNVLDGVTVYAADSHGAVPYHEVDWARPSAVVVGAEAAGLSARVREGLQMGTISPVSIPLTATIESLNAGEWRAEMSKLRSVQPATPTPITHPIKRQRLLGPSFYVRRTGNGKLEIYLKRLRVDRTQPAFVNRQDMTGARRAGPGPRVHAP